MATKTQLRSTKALKLALSVLDLPEGPTFKELQQQAKDYVRNLDPKQYDKLKQEALQEKGEYKDDYVDKLDLFNQMLFTPIEVQAYAGMRIDSPGVRRVIARRALLGILRGWDRIPDGMIHPDVCKMEDAILTRVQGDKLIPLTDEEVLQQLRVYRRRLGV